MALENTKRSSKASGKKREPSKRKTPSSRRARASESKVLLGLEPSECHGILCALVDLHPELADEIEQIVTCSLLEKTFEEIADAVLLGITSLDLERVRMRCESNLFGYMEPGDVIMEMTGEALEPLVSDIGRCSAMGLDDAALLCCQGILLGLYRVEQEENWGLLDWMPEGMEFFVDGPILALKGTSRNARGRVCRLPQALKDFSREYLPEWPDLHGRKPRQGS